MSDILKYCEITKMNMIPQQVDTKEKESWLGLKILVGIKMQMRLRLSVKTMVGS